MDIEKGTVTCYRTVPLISMHENWNLSIDNKGFVCGVLIDLSKAFGTIVEHKVACLGIQQTGFSYSM